ncbi:hypothetical protein MrNuV_ORF027 [Macrobrachium rosenbergii nudivirus]|nr:hypothetical protein MrNuV_ORF027 [Macrobrachium rosenbergii nudivirus]
MLRLFLISCIFVMHLPQPTTTETISLKTLYTETHRIEKSFANMTNLTVFIDLCFSDLNFYNVTNLKFTERLKCINTNYHLEKCNVIEMFNWGNVITLINVRTKKTIRNNHFDISNLNWSKLNIIQSVYMDKKPEMILDINKDIHIKFIAKRNNNNPILLPSPPLYPDVKNIFDSQFYVIKKDLIYFFGSLLIFLCMCVCVLGGIMYKTTRSQRKNIRKLKTIQSISPTLPRLLSHYSEVGGSSAY